MEKHTTGTLRGAGAFEKTHVGRAEKEREWGGKTERADGARWRRDRVRMGTRRERNDPRATEQQLQRSAEGVDRSTVEGGEMSARADGLLGLLVGLIIGRECDGIGLCLLLVCSSETGSDAMEPPPGVAASRNPGQGTPYGLRQGVIRRTK